MTVETGELWEAALAEYRAAGWEDEPGDWERMFWEAGLRAGITHARTEGKPEA